MVFGYRPPVFEIIFQLLTRVNSGVYMCFTVAGFALVHIAAVLLFTATAPVLGLLLAFVGFALYGFGMRKPFLKSPASDEADSHFFKA